MRAAGARPGTELPILSAYGWAKIGSIARCCGVSPVCRPNYPAKQFHRHVQNNSIGGPEQNVKTEMDDPNHHRN